MQALRVSGGLGTADARRAVAPAAGRPWWTLAVPALIYLGGQLLTVAVTQVFAHVQRLRPWGWIATWDGQYYWRIAQWGYAAPQWAMRHSRGSPVAFFPGYPLVVGVGRAVTGADTVGVGVAVSLVAGVLLAWGLVALAGELGLGRRAGLVLVLLVSTGPMAAVLSMVYAEALFCAGAVWTLVLLQRRSWLPAGLLCAATGLVRPTGAALVAAVAAAVVAAAVQGRAPLRAWAALALAPTGFAGYLAWVAWRTGSPAGWFIVQRTGWHTSFDGGLYTAWHLLVSTVAPRDVLDVVTAAAVVGSGALLVVMVRRRWPWPVVAFAAVVLLLDLGNAGYWSSKVRLMVPAFPLLLVLAHTLVRDRDEGGRPRARAVAAVVTWVVLGTAYSAWAVTVYPHAI